MRGLKIFALAAVAASLALASVAQAATLGATISTRIIGTYTGSGDLATPSAPFDVRFSTTLANGTGSGQAGKVFSDERTITASSSENLDLAGSLTDAFGTTITCGAVKVISISAAAANTNDVVVGGAASNGFYGMFDASTDTISVRPGGTLLLVAPKTGWTVTAATGDILKVANSSSGSSVTYDVVIVCT